MTTMPLRPVPSATTGSADVEPIVRSLRKTFASGRTRSLQWRLDQLAGIVRFCDEREKDIADALMTDLGRPAFDAWLGDVGSSRAEAEFAIKHLRRWTRSRRSPMPLSLKPGRAFYQYEPLGTVLIIGPWNYPVFLTLGPLVGAIAAGNCAIIKPSEHAPETSRLLAEILPLYVDPTAAAVVEGEAGVTQALMAQGLDHVFFTGGPEIGKLVMAAAAPTLTPVTLELGGKSPSIVTRNADIEIAARRIAWTKILNSGQTCITTDYVLVESSVRQQFLAALEKSITDMRSGSPAMLPIVNARQFDRLTSLLGSHGGEVVMGGGVDVDSNSIEPTVIADPDLDSRLMTEEIFGPILPVISLPSLDAAIEHVNSGPKPLAAYLFSNSKSERDRVLAEISAGGMVVNQTMFHCTVPSLPFGGVGNSGMGAYHGEWGFQTFSHRKAVLVKPAKPDLSLLYPPYSERAQKLLRRFI